MGDFIVRLIARLDASKTNGDIKKIEQQLNAKGIKLKTALDTAASKQEMNNLVRELQSILSLNGLTINTSTLRSAINQVAKETTKIFNTSELDKQGKIYIQKISNTIEKTKAEVSSKLKSAGYADIQIKGIEDANGKIKSLIATATDANGVLKQLAFTREKIQGNGKAQSGLVETNDLKVLGNVSDFAKNIIANLENLKQRWTEQGILIGDFKLKVEQLETSLANVSSKSSLSTLHTELQNINTEASRLSQVNRIKLSIAETGDTSVKIAQLQANFSKLGFNSDEVRVKMNGVTTALSELNSAINSNNSQAIITANKKLKHSLIETSNAYGKLKTDTNAYYNLPRQSKLTNDIQNWLLKNTAATAAAKAELQQYLTLLNENRVNVSTLNKISSKLKEIDTQMRSTNHLGKSFGQTFSEGIKKFSYWTSSTFLIMKTIQEVRQAVTNVRELDTSLVDLRKTTTMTATQLEDFYENSNDVAKQMGVATKEILDQAAAWSRLGYGSNFAATQMSEMSSKFKLISPSMNSDEATSGLVSIMKAYDVEVSDVLDGIISKVNVVGNTFALTNSDIVAMLQDSVSAMAEGNNTLEQTIALETAAFEIAQDRSVGNGFKTVALRLRGLNEETEKVDESLKTIKGDLYDLTGVSIMQDENTLKSTYQILSEISEVWYSLTDKTQAEALELMFGKLRANIGSAVIKNFEAAEQAMDEMTNSAGNADAEMSIAIDSIDYKLNRLSETGVGISQNLFQRDDMKNIIDVLTKVAETVDFLTSKIGLFGTIAASTSIFTFFKNFDWLNQSCLKIA